MSLDGPGLPTRAMQQSRIYLGNTGHSPTAALGLLPGARGHLATLVTGCPKVASLRHRLAPA
jgi:hypothetical protein